MTDDIQRRQRSHKRIWIILSAVFVVLVVLLVPPLISIGRYKTQITHLISVSLSRPVHLSSVEWRLLPWPGFVLDDLTVYEDPGYGAEPVLHANTVTASIRLLPLWRGRLEIGTISVDEASLNVVRAPGGRWNLDPLFRTAAANAGQAADKPGAEHAVSLPYMEATDSRINFKNGAEKLPFSLVNTDFSFWQESPGDWRIRLRGQPVRTDLSLDDADTGEVRLEGQIHDAPALRQMPVHLDMDWREAQLGQLTRLLFGTDAGWRGGLTGELHVDGTPNDAHITARLRATGVHRAEFAPAAPLDFDARCSLAYHYSQDAIENLACYSPLGEGRILLAGDLPAEDGTRRLSVQLDQISAAAGLALLRTVRSGIDPDLAMSGAVSGKITYATAAPGDAGKGSEVPAKTERPSRGRLAGERAAEKDPYSGELSVQDFQLSGAGLSQPIRVPRLVLEPALDAQKRMPVLETTADVAMGAEKPLTISSHLTLGGYQMTMSGEASLGRLREVAHVAGIEEAKALDALSAGPAAVDLSIAGPWVLNEGIPVAAAPASGAGKGTPATFAGVVASTEPEADSVSGTLTLRNARWTADYLAHPVEISEATLHLANGQAYWNPVEFSYGTVKGTANLSVPRDCEPMQLCLPHFEVQFGALNAGTLQKAFLGASKHGTLLSTLIASLHLSSAPAWPQLEGTVKAESLVLGPVTLYKPTAAVRIQPSGAKITSLDAGLLGGHVHGSGSLNAPSTGGNAPAYSFDGTFARLSAPAVGHLLGLRWSGGDFNADGKIDLSGFTASSLAASATGKLHFEWRRGSVAAEGAQKADLTALGRIPPALVRFDRWIADAAIEGGKITLQENQVVRGASKQSVEATLTFGEPSRVSFSGVKNASAAFPAR